MSVRERSVHILSAGLGLLRFAMGLKHFLRGSISVETAKVVIRQRMQARDRAFLDVVEHAIFKNPSSPYL